MLDRIFPFNATTEGVTVRAAPRYLPEQSDPDGGRHVWAYHIRVENGGDLPVQLLARHWLITDGNGRVEQVQGDGVIGQQPVIMPGGAHDYVSGCPLPTPHGRMEGSYLMRDGAGRRFRVAIPMFELRRPSASAPQ